MCVSKRARVCVSVCCVCYHTWRVHQWWLNAPSPFVTSGKKKKKKCGLVIKQPAFLKQINCHQLISHCLNCSSGCQEILKQSFEKSSLISFLWLLFGKFFEAREPRPGVEFISPPKHPERILKQWHSIFIKSSIDPTGSEKSQWIF